MQTTDLLRLLPEIIRRTAQRGTPLDALLQTMASLPLRDETILGALDAYFDPDRAPDRFVPFLATWVDLAWLPVLDLEPGAGAAQGAVEVHRLRDLIKVAPRLAQLRGTAAGLALFLGTATGVAGIRVLDSGSSDATVRRLFHLRVEVPAAAAQQRALIELIARMEKPAHVTCEVVLQA
jgi:phage tail-like protein